MFNKILIANRGEIACRVIKTAKRLGIRTVAVYSDADVNALHVKLADEAIHIGAASSSESYLLSERIIKAALRTDAEAIHPGYGFLSENADFANACASNKLTFIGPPASAIEAMGSKSAAKNIMEAAKVPLVPGYHGDDQNPALLKQAANDMGYPVLLKAVAGGGGKGMRQVWSDTEFDQALAEAKREAIASFGNGDMLVEKYLTQPRHVEVQVFCDQQGDGVYLFERDCSVQRRHQKVIEEAPAPNVSPELRAAMGDTAIRAAQAIDYQGAGTVEFLLDSDDSFYFMEMNTRLQVEHPVTEMITGQDLVEWQLKIANGEPLPKTQDQLVINGHAFEARVYAEDPSNDFLPTTGTLQTLITPEQTKHVRVDTGVLQGDEVSPYYDPMIAKLIVWGEDRNNALRRMAKALRDYRINGVTTNLSFLYDLATNQAFKNAELDTGFIEKHQSDLFKQQGTDITDSLVFAAVYLHLEKQVSDADSERPGNPWSSNNAWRMNQANRVCRQFGISETTYAVELEFPQYTSGDNGLIAYVNGERLNVTASLNGEHLTATINGYKKTVSVSHQKDSLVVFSQHGATIVDIIAPDLGEEQSTDSGNAFVAPMNGTIIEIFVDAGDQVKAGQAVLIMEAMKMQHTMNAPVDGQIDELFCSTGELVDGGTTLLSFVEQKVPE